MKNIQLFAGVAVLAVFCGCQHTHVDQVTPGQGRQDWYRDIRESYPGFRPPRLVSPGISGQSTRQAQPAPVAPATPADVKDESASQTPAVDVVPMEIEPAAKVEAPKTEAPAAKVEAPKTEAPAAKVEAPKTEAPAAKVEAPKTEAKAVEPPDPTSSQVYVVKSGDILSAISVKFYGSARYVNVIKKANSDILPDANKLKPGMKLIIPKL
ncbi:MAG: LysM peptidoglycan-binding domain-containing protein [Lentisphaeria bacterium]|nr:LysM peptidoglycan-binding domain-containing protein [Lentisphaeria bacterium]